eukprot:scaffold17855_cov52-Phaeocystis_antarctica.AAC.3
MKWCHRVSKAVSSLCCLLHTCLTPRRSQSLEHRSRVEPWLPGCRVLPGRVAGLPGRCRVSAGLPG